MSKKGTTLAEIIICFALLVILISMMTGAIQFSHKMIVKAAEIRETAAQIAVKLIKDTYANNPSATSLEKQVTLSDVDAGGSLTMNLVLILQNKEILTESGVTYRFLVYATP